MIGSSKGIIIAIIISKNMNLRLKITSLVVLVMALLLGGAATYIINESREHALERASAQAIAYAGLIKTEVESVTAKGGHSREIQKSIESIGGAGGVMAARLLDSNLKILKSTDSQEIGRESQSGESGSNNPGVLLKRLNIQYSAECIGCHVIDGSSMGSDEVVFDIAPLEYHITALKKSLLVWAVAILMLLAGVLAFVFTRTVLDPIEIFRRTVRAVRDGDLSARAQTMGSGDMAVLGEDFNAMLGEVSVLHDQALRKEREISRVKAELDHKVLLEELNTQLQHKVKEVESANKAVLSLSKEIKYKNVELEVNVDRLKRINEVGRVLSSIIDHEELLKLIIKTTSDTLRVEKGTIHVVRNRTQAITMSFHGGLGFLPDEGSVGIDPLFQDMLLEGRQILHNEEHDTRGRARRSALGVPLKMKGQIMGGILLERKNEGGGFTHDELQILDTMANQAMILSRRITLEPFRLWSTPWKLQTATQKATPRESSSSG
jgi:methyl-accepting chemotaxis protein